MNRVRCGWFVLAALSPFWLGGGPLGAAERARPYCLNFVPTVRWLPRPTPVVNSAAGKESEMKPYTDRIAGVAFDMLPIRGGRFMMGSPAGEQGRKADEGPQHEVAVEPFWMGKCEVTWNQFDAWYDPVKDRRPRTGKREMLAWEGLADAIALPSHKPYTDPGYGMGKEGYPAVNMTHFAARLYCKWLSSQTGRYYRLPTEAEWEYACRAGTTTAYCFGDDPQPLKDYAWYEDNSLDKYQRVGTKRPNPWGLHDMHGNVAEWVADAYAPAFYNSRPATEKNPLALPKGRYPHVYRGGAWCDDSGKLRSAARQASNEALSAQDPQMPQSMAWHTDAPHIGFRLVRPLRPPTEEECRRFEPTDEELRKEYEQLLKEHRS